MSRLYRAEDRRRAAQPRSAAALPPWRSEFRRDYARLVHSPAFRRLQGKTQLFAGAESDFFRNRLTHSLEVAQIAKAIAIKLNAEALAEADMALDLDLVELAALAHDLGHPPFGHTGESALDRSMLSHGGFEGNAQTLRILSRLEKKLDDDAIQLDHERNQIRWFDESGDTAIGLNLTFRSLASVLKYDKRIPARRQEKAPLRKGYYGSERLLVSMIRGAVSRQPRRGRLKTIECQIMDLADDIAYSTYDVEDSFEAGLLNPLDLLGASDSIRAGVGKRCEKELGVTVTLADLAGALQRIFADLSTASAAGTERPLRDELLALYRVARLTADNGFFRGEFVTVRVGRAIQAITVEPDADDPARSKVKMDPEIRLEVAVLKHLVYALLIESPRLKLVARRGTRIVESIFDELCDDGGHELMPPDWIERYEQAPGEPQRRRVVADFIAGMTDRQAVDFHARLTSSDYRTMFGLA